MAGIIFTDADRIGSGRRASPLESRSLSRRLFLGGALSSAMLASGATRLGARGDVATPDATPGGAVDGPDALIDLLSRIPRRFASIGGGSIAFAFADVGAQFAARGVDLRDEYTRAFEDGEGDPAVFFSVIRPMATLSPAYANAPEIEGAVGLQPLLAEQTLVVGDAPDQVTLFRGGIDLDRLPAAWEAAGYARKSNDAGYDIWTVGEAGEIDVASERGFVNPSLNNVAILDSGVVVFGQLYDSVSEVTALGDTDEASMLDVSAVRRGVEALPPDTASALMTGPILGDPAAELLAPEYAESQRRIFAAIDEEVGPMPESDALVLGITAGFADPPFQPTGEGTPYASPEPATAPDGPENGAIVVRLLTASADDATRAAAVVERRWEEGTSLTSGLPLTDLMRVIDAKAEEDVAYVDFQPVRSPSVWIDLVSQRDLAAFAPTPPDLGSILVG